MDRKHKILLSNLIKNQENIARFCFTELCKHSQEIATNSENFKHRSKLFMIYFIDKINLNLRKVLNKFVKHNLSEIKNSQIKRIKLSRMYEIMVKINIRNQE